MYTIIESPVFQEKSSKIWSQDERLAFFSFIAQNPIAGDVIPKANGLRKVRWNYGHSGKRGGVRVIYFNQLNNGVILMLDLYTKNTKENFTAQDIHHIQGEIYV